MPLADPASRNLPSPIQTILSVPESHRVHRLEPLLAPGHGLIAAQANHRRSGIAPCPEGKSIV